MKKRTVERAPNHVYLFICVEKWESEDGEWGHGGGDEHLVASLVYMQIYETVA